LPLPMAEAFMLIMDIGSGFGAENERMAWTSGKDDRVIYLTKDEGYCVLLSPRLVQQKKVTEEVRFD
jgi:hypothetical protein